jgi:hypothetical protein
MADWEKLIELLKGDQVDYSGDRYYTTNQGDPYLDKKATVDIQSVEYADALAQVTQLIHSGRPDANVRVRVDDKYIPRTFTGRADKVAQEMVDFRKEVTDFHVEKVGKEVDVVKKEMLKMKANIIACGGTITNDLVPDWENLMTNVRDTLAQLNNPSLSRFQEKLGLQDIQRLRDELATCIIMPTVNVTGSNKTDSLNDRRLLKEPDGTRLPPVSEDIKLLLKVSNTTSTTSVLDKVLLPKYEHIFKLFYPKVYNEVGGYYSPKVPALNLTNVTVSCIQHGYHKAPTAHRLIVPALKYMVEHKMPMFFIAPLLLEAIELTDFADDINWVEMKLPYDHGIFMLPKNALIHHEDGPVSMILWSRLTPGEYPPPVGGLPTIKVHNNGFRLLALCHENLTWYVSVLTEEISQTLRFRNMFNLDKGSEHPSLPKLSSMCDEELTTKDQEFSEQIAVIAFGTLMAMNARPELIDRGKLERRVTKRDDVKEFWSPNVIGIRYKHRREVPKVVDGKFQFTDRVAGTHASPRFHFRRGHMRQQACGKGLKERKSIWIMPVAVNAVTD